MVQADGNAIPKNPGNLGMGYERAAELEAGVKALRPELRVKLRYPQAVSWALMCSLGAEYVIYDALPSSCGGAAVMMLGMGDDERGAWRDAVRQIECREGQDVFNRLWREKRAQWLD